MHFGWERRNAFWGQFLPWVAIKKLFPNNWSPRFLFRRLRRNITEDAGASVASSPLLSLAARVGPTGVTVVGKIIWRRVGVQKWGLCILKNAAQDARRWRCHSLVHIIFLRPLRSRMLCFEVPCYLACLLDIVGRFSDDNGHLQKNNEKRLPGQVGKQSQQPLHPRAYPTWSSALASAPGPQPQYSETRRENKKSKKHSPRKNGTRTARFQPCARP